MQIDNLMFQLKKKLNQLIKKYDKNIRVYKNII